MTTVGEILTNARASKNLSLEQVEKSTKIRAKFLEALEKNQFDKLPPGTFAKGFIKNYASFLGLSEEDVLAFYRRGVHEDRTKASPVREVKLPGNIFSFTSQTFTTASVILLLLAFFGYLVFSYFEFAGSPSLTISSPLNNTVVTHDQVDVIGKTDPETTLTINNQTVPENENGSFDVQIPLQPGLNTLTITAINKFKRQSTITRNIRLEK